MKSIKILTITLLALFITGSSFAQGNFFSKKEDLKDLNHKTLMVVLENNSLIDITLKNAVEKEWELSKYEFCNLEEFDKIKGDSSYYFLIRVKGIFKKEREPAIEFLSLLKGGPEGVKGVDAMYDVLSLPFQPVDDGDGYILPYIDAYIKVIQAHVLRVQRHKIAASMGIGWYSNRLSEIKNKKVLLNENDLSDLLNKEEVNNMLNGHGNVVDEDAVYEALDNEARETLVSVCIAPRVEQQGSYCYKMLLSTDGHELFYYRKQKVNANNPKGFLPDDVKKIAIPFSF